jgi:hypothetical protein
VTIGGWFFPRRRGEQYFFFRGMPEIGPQGERYFRPADNWVNFILGTDQHGFLLGTIHGNGSMPFVHVTVNAVAFDAWNQLVVVKDAWGFQKFYLNGTLLHRRQAAAGKSDRSGHGPGEPVRWRAAGRHRRNLGVLAELLRRRSEGFLGGQVQSALPGRQSSCRRWLHRPLAYGKSRSRLSPGRKSAREFERVP